MDVRNKGFGQDMIEGWQSWPKEDLGGWIPGNYDYSIICKRCKGLYAGSKHSWHCYPCAVKIREENVINNLGSQI